MKHLPIFILFFLFSCNSSDNSTKIVDITSKIDKAIGFSDITLSITDTKTSDSTMIYTALGLYNSDTVGLQISLKKGIKAGIVNGEMKNPFVKNGIMLHSIGIKSDKLLNAISNLYGFPNSSLKMIDEFKGSTCANLNQEDVNFNSGEYKFKIFLETEEDNSELFVNFDFTNKYILLNEKDQEYRKGIVKYLTKK